MSNNVLMNSKTCIPYGFHRKHMRTDAERQASTKISPQRAINRYIQKIEDIVRKKDDHSTFKEYWKLGMFLIRHKRHKQGLEYLKNAIEYKQEGQHDCIYHEQGVYNTLLTKLKRQT